MKTFDINREVFVHLTDDGIKHFRAYAIAHKELLIKQNKLSLIKIEETIDSLYFKRLDINNNLKISMVRFMNIFGSYPLGYDTRILINDKQLEEENSFYNITENEKSR